MEIKTLDLIARALIRIPNSIFFFCPLYIYICFRQILLSSEVGVCLEGKLRRGRGAWRGETKEKEHWMEFEFPSHVCTLRL